MPRANRHFLPGQFWHITHRCHEKAFLLKFARDRSSYLWWLFEARKCFGLRLLNYVVTSNHIHMLVQDTGGHAIAQSLQLVAGRTAQDYNRRKRRRGAFWKDRYHATAIEGDEHLWRCVVYMDLNLVRAGAVEHPAAWAHGGYCEIQNPPDRYRLIDLPLLTASCGFGTVENFQRDHRDWIKEALGLNALQRDPRWSEALAVGSQAFVDSVKQDLGMKARHREVEEEGDSYTLRLASSSYMVDSDIKSSGLRRKYVVVPGQNAVAVWG